MSYCTSCGSPIPDGQGKSCSMCYGDPDHGRDGYYRKFLEEQEQHANEQGQIEMDQEERQRQSEADQH